MSVPLRKFIELFEFVPKSGRKAAEGVTIGRFPFYRSSQTVDRFTDHEDYSANKLIFGTGGGPSVHYARTAFSASADCLVAAPRDDNATVPSYVWHYLRGNIHLLERGFRGAGLKHVSKRYIEAIDVPCPPLPEQRRIAALLDKADDIRRTRRQAVTLASDLVPAIFYSMFGDPAVASSAAPSVPVEQLLSPCGLRCGPFGSALHKEDYIDEGIPVWGIDNVRPNHFIEDGCLFIHPSKYEELTAYKVRDGDILISRAGTVGRMCVARPSRRPCIIGTNLIRVRLRHDAIVPEYFCTLFTFFGGRLGSLRANPGEGAYSFMKTGVLKRIEIPVPPMDLQRIFAATVAKVRDTETAYKHAAQGADDLFASLMQRAFRGDV